tara:strand:- start:146 stop:874 length:729 start_codon:yes stop_codon:yes gene_type:complete
MEIDDAIKKGAIALFGEKYGDRVRVVTIGKFSKELCGGTHINATGDIGLFKIVSEGGIASGVRRIEAVTGIDAIARIQKEEEALSSMRSLLKASPSEEVTRLKKVLDRIRELEKENDLLKEKLLSGKEADENILRFEGFSAILQKLESPDPKTLRLFIDNCKNKLKTGVVVVGGTVNGKVIIAAGVTKDLTKRFHAGDIIKDIAELIDGSGGGRADMAQAGGTKPEMLDIALKKVENILSAG